MTYSTKNNGRSEESDQEQGRDSLRIVARLRILTDDKFIRVSFDMKVTRKAKASEAVRKVVRRFMIATDNCGFPATFQTLKAKRIKFGTLGFKGLGMPGKQNLI